MESRRTALLWPAIPCARNPSLLHRKGKGAFVLHIESDRGPSIAALTVALEPIRSPCHRIAPVGCKARPVLREPFIPSEPN